MEQKYIDRFHTKYEKKATGCWEWIGTCWEDRGGYGAYLVDGKRIRAHRFSAMIHGMDMSKPIVRHLCNNPKCVNPAHLATGSAADNMNDKVVTNRQTKGTEFPQSKLTEQQVLEIRSKYVPYKYSTVKLAKEYNVSNVLIGNIIRREVWKHL